MIKMKKLVLVLIAAVATQYTTAQVSLLTSQVNNACFGDSSGVVTVDSLSGCYAPLTIIQDTNEWTFHQLKNDGYHGLKQGGGAGTDQGTGIAAGATSIGDVFVVAGYFEDSIVLDSITLYANAAAGGSGWVATYDAASNGILWAHAITGGGNAFCAAYGSEIVGDKAFTVGYFEQTASFGTEIVVSTGSYQGFIMKTDIPTGTIDTVLQVGNAGIDETTNISVGEDDRLYVSGDFTGSINLGGTTLNSSASYDLFVTCFDTSLTTNYWAAAAGGSSFDVARDLVPHSVNGVVEYVYTTGYYYGTAAFGSNTLNSATGQDVFVAKVDTLGNWIWAEGGNGPGEDDAFTIDISPSGEKLYVGGRFQNTLSYAGSTITSAGNFDGYIAYLDTSGVIEDVYQMGGGGRDGILDLDVSGEDDYIVFVGEFALSYNFADSTFITNGGVGTDCFTGKLGPNLNEIWGKNFGGTSAVTEAFNSVAIGPNERLHCTGTFNGNASAYQSGLIATGTDAIMTNEVITGTVDTTIMFMNLPASELTLVLTDTFLNATSDTLTITEPDAIVISATTVATSDPSTNDGSIDLTVSGGTAPFSYMWSNSDTSEDIDSLSAGWYMVTVMDSLGCTAMDSFFVDSTVILNMSVTGVVSDKTCQTDNNGVIDISVVNGIPPYSYAWSNNATTEDISGLTPGTYTVTVTDSNSETVTELFTVSDNPIHPDPVVGPISGAVSAQWWTNFNYTVPATNGSIFDWSTDGTGDVVSSTANAAIVAWRAGPSGMVYVTETDINGCRGSDSLAVEILVAGTSELLENRMMVFPNPATDLINVELSEGLIGAQINLFDIEGQRVANAKSIESTATINVSELAAGSYLLVLEKDGQRFTQTIVVN